MAPLQARVFISCGQASEEERNIAVALGDVLTDQGYEVFIATEQLSFKGVKEGIFPKLVDSEYFLFVDFQRERLIDQEGREKGVRGSLFSHQELAVAAFRDLDYIGFRHRSAALEGLSRFMLSNATPFDHATELPQLLRHEVEKRGWRPDWRNQLRFSRAPAEFDATNILTPKGSIAAVYYHLNVENKHQDKLALGCVAYAEAIRDAKTGENFEFRQSEQKWAGTQLATIAIPAGRTRQLDICFLVEGDTARVIHFGSHSDSTLYMSPVAGIDIDVDFVVLSENFPPARCTVRIEHGVSARDAKVRLID